MSRYIDIEADDSKGGDDELSDYESDDGLSGFIDHRMDIDGDKSEPSLGHFSAKPVPRTAYSSFDGIIECLESRYVSPDSSPSRHRAQYEESETSPFSKVVVPPEIACLPDKGMDVLEMLLEVPSPTDRQVYLVQCPEVRSTMDGCLVSTLTFQPSSSTSPLSIS
ncbi:hypothetical protein K474DRAFT_1311231 [Panus rudis PR-1116 ss-1]|nr:hypothetical protein K474DRAFT_1311231 [Panus rudis PR-1116 ss-1]